MLPSDGRLRKREFRAFMNAVVAAMSAAGDQSLDEFLTVLRSHVTVSHSLHDLSVLHALGCLLVLSLSFSFSLSLSLSLSLSVLTAILHADLG